MEKYEVNGKEQIFNLKYLGMFMKKYEENFVESIRTCFTKLVKFISKITK